MLLTPIVKALNFTSKIESDHAMLRLEAAANLHMAQPKQIDLKMVLATPLSY